MVEMFKIKYRRATVTLKDNPRKGWCECCGRKGKTGCHHFRYAYKTKEVRKKPILALDNTAELCFLDHRIANALQLIERYPQRVEVLKALFAEKIEEKNADTWKVGG